MCEKSFATTALVSTKIRKFIWFFVQLMANVALKQKNKQILLSAEAPGLHTMHTTKRQQQHDVWLGWRRPGWRRPVAQLFEACEGEAWSF